MIKRNINLTDEELEFLGNLYLKLKEKNISVFTHTFEQFVKEYLEDNIKWLEKFRQYLS